jgi:multidrug efflux pump subunit AcrB
VLSIVIVLAGAISLFTLPLAQFPPISPPTVQVQCNYPGASAKEVADAVAAPIEQQVNGVERMMYMSSQCANDGSYSLTVTFFPGIDLNMAQVLVQNRVSLAIPQLPEVIKQTGVSTRKRSPDILMGIAMQSDGRYDQLYLSNFALMQVKDELARLDGIGDIFLFGQRDYSMRIWLDPDQLGARGLVPADVVRAIREQNSQVAVGAIGQEPMNGPQKVQITLSTLGRLEDVEQFENIIVKTTPRGRIVRLKDVATVEMGAKSHDIRVRLDGNDTVFLAIFQMPDANALDLRQRILAKMEELRPSFPDGVTYDIGFDTTPYTRESINEVVKTLRDAVILVALVVLLFLQNWRSALIPLVAVPVAIVGTFAVMAAFGFSLNNLTLFGLVLAIGIVVDDAIVVVEAVEHHIEQGLPPRQATIEAMRQVSGPVIAVALVLSAVFVPCAFIGGITGAFFRQFALTISVSTIISAFNSLTLSPALTALLLRPRDQEARSTVLPRLAIPLILMFAAWELLSHFPLERVLPANVSEALARLPGWSVLAAALALAAGLGWLVSRPLNAVLGHAFRAFNSGFSRTTSGYVWLVKHTLRVSAVALLLYVGLLGVTYFAFQRTPKGFIPSQDMGILFVNVQLPDSASIDRTDEVMRRIEKIALNTPGVKHCSGLTGQSFVLSAAGSNFGSCFVNLKEYEFRRDPALSSDAIANKLRMEFAKIHEANVAVFAPAPVRGVGRAGGVAMMIEDRGDFGPQELQRQTENLLRLGNKLPGVAGMFTIFRANVPQYKIDPDLGACMIRGVEPQAFADTLSTYEGSTYVNDFNRFGRTWQVIVQAQPQFRAQPEDVPQLRTRNKRGVMIPLGSLADQQVVNGPLVLNRYNMYPSATINGLAAPGFSSGQVLDALRKLAEDELPQSMSFEWTDMSFLEQLAGNTGILLFALAVMMVFLVLAAQYESWSLPLAVILVVPMCLLSAIVGVQAAAQDINIFTQIGFVVLVGLACKNAILIVEFAKQRREMGEDRVQATLDACRLRLRPIIMTSLAFILGVIPLIVSQGAGAEMRRTLGTAVFAGMLGVTLFGIVLTPVFFYTIDRLGSTTLFASHPVRFVGRILLDVLTLGIPRLAAMSRRARVSHKRIKVMPHPNGKHDARQDVGEPGASAPGEHTPHAS